jgi:hypothetical protein
MWHGIFNRRGFLKVLAKARGLQRVAVRGAHRAAHSAQVQVVHVRLVLRGAAAVRVGVVGKVKSHLPQRRRERRGKAKRAMCISY